MSASKAVFFMRAYNDMDHLTPVVWKWATTTGLPSTVVLRMGKNAFEDYRIRFLSSLPGVEVRHVSEFFPDGAPANSDDAPAVRSRQTPSLLSRAVRRARRLIRGKQPTPPKPNPLSPEPIAAMVEQLFAGVERGIVVFDWVSNPSANRTFAELTIQAAKARGIANISLPHGDSPYYNKMFKLADINYESVEHYDGNPSDCVVVPNPLTAERYIPFRDTGRLKILGSARYNQEWMDVLAGLLPPFELPGSEDKLKLVMFLRNPVFPIFWEEVIKAIEICTQFDDVMLVVKHHTRGGQPTNKNHRDHLEMNKLNAIQRPNLQVVYNDTHSGSLLQWCDAVLELGTSISFEAVRLNKPLLALEYLHANLSTVAHYIPSTALNYKDQLYDEVERLRKDRTHRLYTEADCQHFLGQIIDYPDGEVLQRYADLLLERMEGTPIHARATHPA